MKHLIKLTSALTVLCLHMPGTVIVPDSLPVRGEIISRSFSAMAPHFS